MTFIIIVFEADHLQRFLQCFLFLVECFVAVCADGLTEMHTPISVFSFVVFMFHMNTILFLSLILVMISRIHKIPSLPLSSGRLWPTWKAASARPRAAASRSQWAEQGQAVQQSRDVWLVRAEK